jgi:UPF0755 protein
MSERSLGFRALARFGGLLLLLLAAAAGAVAWTAWRWLDRPLPLASPTVAVTVQAGQSPRQVAQAWADAGVQTPPWLLYEWFRWSGQAASIRAGSYELTIGATPRDLLQRMVKGLEVLESLRLPEGQTLREWRRLLATAPHLSPDSAKLDDAALMAALGSPGVAAEGRFFPDTYAYGRGSSDLAVLQRAHDAMRRHLDDAWAARDPDTPLRSADEALILASIVEKETGRDEERGLVAGVFTNRLRLGMPLQTDPTVIYGLGAAFDGNLRKRDLLADGPYNTYTRQGLPPTPITMPSLASLQAAVRPTPTKALYFVARGDGSSAFSESLGQHNRAVDQYQRKRR